MPSSLDLLPRLAPFRIARWQHGDDWLPDRNGMEAECAPGVAAGNPVISQRKLVETWGDWRNRLLLGATEFTIHGIEIFLRDRNREVRDERPPTLSIGLSEPAFEGSDVHTWAQPPALEGGQWFCTRSVRMIRHTLALNHSLRRITPKFCCKRIE